MQQKKTEKEIALHMRRIERIIEEVLIRDVRPELRSLFLYQVKTGGKRLRPALALGSCLACGGRARDVGYPAAALELLHTYTLIIDDIIDRSPRRRGKPSTWTQFGKSIAECVSMGYGAALVGAAGNSPDPAAVSELLSKTLKEIVEGEIYDILFEQRKRKGEDYIEAHRFSRVSLEDYTAMASKKTASLFGASCEIGGVVAGASVRDRRALSQYGRHLGMAFQITDDILDFYGKEEFDKPKAQDMREGKLGNILVLLALRESSMKDKKNMARILKKKEITGQDTRRFIGLLEKTSAKEEAIRLAERYAREAKRNVRRIASNPYRDFLEEAADHVLERAV